MKRHALFVGVDQYADGHIPNLSCAVNDAMDLHGFFKYGAGYDRVELLQNPPGKKEVLGAVRELTSGLGAGDFFLFFFAGHGSRVGENHVLVCGKDLYDDVKYEEDGLPLGQLKRRLAGPFGSALLLDACQSDILATRGGEGIAERDLELIHAPPGGGSEGALTIVTSCDAGQTAAELAERRHGLFTMAMLELLREAQGAHVRLDLSDAFRQRLGRRMGEIAARSGLSTGQRPRFSCSGDSCFVLLDGAVPDSFNQRAQHPSVVTPRPAVPSLVVCPVCGRRNEQKDTFRCRECGRDNLCLRHQDAASFLCYECVAERKQKAAEGGEGIGQAFADETHGREEVGFWGWLFGGKSSRMAVPIDTQPQKLQAGDTKTIALPGGASMEMVWCPPGEFMMGSDDGFDNEWPPHKVILTEGFWMAKHPVTQAQWKRVMGTTVRQQREKCGEHVALNNPVVLKMWNRRDTGGVMWSIRGEGDNHPIYYVNWDEAEHFCLKTGLKLPTEAQWEYACRAGSTGAYAGTGNLDEMGWCNVGETRPVGRKRPNAWGLHDMHGNVNERCADWYDGEYYAKSPLKDPQGPATGEQRVMRGGDCEKDRVSVSACRSACRRTSLPYMRGLTGLRPVCPAKTEWAEK